MAFQLNSVVPWGRNIDEYFSMFNLSDKDNKNFYDSIIHDNETLLA